MSRDATGIWSGLATERIACPVCKAEVGQVCDLSDMALESTNGTHLDRIDAYGQIHNTFDVSKPLDLKPCPFCATTQSDVPDTVVTITNDVGRTCVFCLKCEACGPIADEVISTVVEYYEAVQAMNTYEPETIKICDPIDLELTQRLDAVIPAFRALVENRKVPSRAIAAENAALRVFVIDVKSNLRKILASAPEVAE